MEIHCWWQGQNSKVHVSDVKKKFNWKTIGGRHGVGLRTDKVCTRIASKCLRSCIYTFYFHLFSPWPLLEIWIFNIAHVPLFYVRLPVLRVLRHDCAEADSIAKLEEGGSNLFVVLRRMQAVLVLRTVEEEKHRLQRSWITESFRGLSCMRTSTVPLLWKSTRREDGSAAK